MESRLINISRKPFGNLVVMRYRSRDSYDLRFTTVFRNYDLRFTIFQISLNTPRGGSVKRSEATLQTEPNNSPT